MVKPWYRRIFGKKAEKDQKAARSENNEAAKNSDHHEIVSALDSIREQLVRGNDENTPEKKRERCWRHAEVVGLWLAAFVGISAVFISSHDARQATTDANRAWIGPQRAILSEPLQLGKPMRFEIDYDNVGKSPSLNTEVVYRVKYPTTAEMVAGAVGRAADADNICGGVHSRKGAKVVYPGLLNTYAVFISTKGTRSETDADADILSGAKSIVLEACFAYETMGIEGHSAFCYFYKQGYMKPEQFFGCDGGNSSD